MTTPTTNGFFVGHRGRGFTVSNDLNRNEMRRLYRYLRRRRHMERREARMLIEDFLWMSMRVGTVQRIDRTDAQVFTATTKLEMTVS